MFVINLQTNGAELHLNGNGKKKTRVNKVAEFFDPENTKGFCVENRHCATKVPILKRIVLNNFKIATNCSHQSEKMDFNFDFYLERELWKRHY